ncbi:hypothetical protein PsorP6_006159 [Peronosclerospora sorghi]|uniref:Uncharacterized protein n=1 Tax=Peronosclerospora sorghi TaxID=230839 RepID=A0ACC0W4B4_9STRA|nr:hypothetical protein PsorP6_006159 [Peronosclerospora sorghi]
MFGFNINKLKPNLKMDVHRIGIIKNKKSNAALAQRREVARLLADGEEEKARIRVEGIIQDDFTMEGYEILELMCELLAERAAAAVRNMDGCVNERVFQKLSVQPPSGFLVVNYMKEISKEFKPDGTQEADPMASIPAPTGSTVMRASFSRPEFTALFASVRLATILSLHSFVAVNEVLVLAAPQYSANPPYLPSVPFSNPSTEATATALAALQRTFTLRNKLLNINAVTGSHLIKQNKLLKRLGILLLPHQPQQVMRLKEFQILTSSRHASSDFASFKTVMTRRTSRLLSRRSCMKVINIISIGTTLQYYVVFFGGGAADQSF